MQASITCFNPKVNGANDHGSQQLERASETIGIDGNKTLKVKRRRKNTDCLAGRRICRRQDCPILLLNGTKSHQIVPRLSLKTLQLQTLSKYVFRFMGTSTISKLVSGVYTTEHKCMSCGKDILYKRLDGSKENNYGYAFAAIFFRHVDEEPESDSVKRHNTVEKRDSSFNDPLNLQRRKQWQLALVKDLGLRYLAKDILMLGPRCNRCLTGVQSFTSQKWQLPSQLSGSNEVVQMRPSKFFGSENYLQCDIEPILSKPQLTQSFTRLVNDALYHEHINAIGMISVIGAHEFIPMYPVCRFLHAIYCSLCTPCRKVKELSCSPPVDRTS